MRNYNIFLTVGSQKQKMLCDKILSTTGITDNYSITVISDDDSGFRLGSGGAVLNIIHRYYKSGEKMLIINSGGMSKRSVNYAVRGKAFANVLHNDNVISLLELIIINAERIVANMSSGVLICCSDILVKTDNLPLSFSESTSLCLRADLSTATRHGVMFPDNQGRLIEYLHKKSAPELEKKMLELNSDGVLIDTGINYFSDELCMALYELAASDVFRRILFSHSFELSLYSDIIKVLSIINNKNEYLFTETMNAEHLEAKKLIFEKISEFGTDVLEVNAQRFLHFGSMSEALNNIFYVAEKNDDTYLNLNSYIDQESEIGKGSLLDNAQLECCKVGNGCIISDITLENIIIGNNKSICGIKLADGAFVSIVCDVTENTKDMVGNVSLWEMPRFYKGDSFTDSIKKYYSNSPDKKFSLAYCTENADFDYFYTRQQYLKDMNDYTVSADYLQKRTDIISHYFSTRNKLEQLRCLKDKVEISLPLRVNMSGTWTDAMPYCVDNGGQVINMAVTVDGEKPVRVIIERTDKEGIEFCSDNSSVNFSFNSSENEEDLSDFNLHKAVLDTVGVTAETAIETGFRLTTKVSGIDKGSGLGTSSILLGGCIMAFGNMFGIKYTDRELIQMVFVAEQIMKTGGGWQDQVGGLTPGLKAGTSDPGIEQNIKVENIPVSHFFRNIFSERTVLLPTGQRHFGRFIVNDVVNRYLDNHPDSLEGHKRIRELNEMLTQSIEKDDYSLFINCINTHRVLLKMISPKVTNPAIEKIISKCFEKADAVSFLGAGGGGYLLVILKEDVTQENFKEFVKKEFPSIKSDVKRIDICYDL